MKKGTQTRSLLNALIVLAIMFALFNVIICTYDLLNSNHVRFKEILEEATMLQTSKDLTVTRQLGTVVFLAPQRNNIATHWKNISRFCLLRRAIRSVDQHLNSKYGPYPIHVLVSKDYDQDKGGFWDKPPEDGRYTEEDRALIRSWAPNSAVIFKEVNMYSSDALEPGIDVDLVQKWRKGFEGGTVGDSLGYRSMCRLWSGRLQQMDFMTKFQYYMRMDDDSLLIDDVPFDPFKYMKEHRLQYLWRRDCFDDHGIDQVWNISRPYINVTNPTRWVSKKTGKYKGGQPYNNFHISAIDFWNGPRWKPLWNDLNEGHCFFKYRCGDANVHAMAVMLMDRREYEFMVAFPYRHNSNDLRFENWTKPCVKWKEECERDSGNVLASPT